MIVQPSIAAVCVDSARANFYKCFGYSLTSPCGGSMFVKQVRSDSGTDHYVAVSQITQIKVFKGKATAVLLSGNTVELDAQDAAKLLQTDAQLQRPKA